MRLADRFDEPALDLARPALEVGARHVAVVAGLGDPREDIDDDELVRPERTGAALVRIAGLVAARDNGVARIAALLANGGFQFETQPLRGQDLAAMEERPALDLRRTQDALGRDIAHGAQPVAFADAVRLPRALDLAFRKEQAVGEDQLEAELGQALVKRGGKIGRHAKAAQAVLARDGCDDLGDAGLVAVTRPCSRQAFLVGEHDVEVARALDAAEFQRALDRHLPAAGAEGNEGIVDLDAAEVEHVGARVGVGIKQRGRG